MLVFEAKLEGIDEQYRLLDAAIRTARFVRNACLRYWMDNRDIGRYDSTPLVKLVSVAMGKLKIFC